jgi:hypothetical protein
MVDRSSESVAYIVVCHPRGSELGSYQGPYGSLDAALLAAQEDARHWRDDVGLDLRYHIARLEQADL